MSVMQVPRLIAPGFTLGAALSNRRQDRPCASFPVTTRRIGLTSSAISRPFLGRLRKLDELQSHCHPACIIYHERPTGSASGAPSRRNKVVRGIHVAGRIVALALTSVSVSVASAQAPNFPNHTIKIIVGPSPDVLQPVVVEPRPGAGGKLAATA